jgi:hypothetical protein
MQLELEKLCLGAGRNIWSRAASYGILLYYVGVLRYSYVQLCYYAISDCLLTTITYTHHYSNSSFPNSLA